MAAIALSQSLIHISAFSCPKKSISSISSLPLASLTPRRAPLLAFSLETIVAGFSSPLNRRIQCITASASSSSEDGEAETEEALEKSEIPANDTEGGDAVAEEKPPKKPRIKLGDIMGVNSFAAVIVNGPIFCLEMS